MHSIIRKKVPFYLALLMIGMMIDSCGHSIANPNIIATLSPSKTPSSGIEPSNTPIQSIPHTPASLGILPDVLLNVGTGDWYECGRDYTNQIWISSYPYLTAKPLLIDEQIDFNYPRWSPDGEWIAYVYSDARTINRDYQDYQPSGTDSVWIMRSDGSEKRMISDNLSRLNYGGLEGCMIGTYITRYLVWSPDGKYIAFSHSNIDEGITTYYVADVNNDITRELETQEIGRSPIWMPDTSELIIIGDKITVYTIETTQNIKSREIPYPPEIPENAIFGFETDLKYHIQPLDRSLISSFFILETRESWYHSTWQVNIDTGNWTSLENTPNYQWGNPVLGETRAATCGLDRDVYIIDPVTWSVKSKYSSQTNSFTCALLDILQDDAGQDVVSYYSNEIEERDDMKLVTDEGIYVSVLLSDTLAPILLIDINHLDIPISLITLRDYSWRAILK